MTEELLFVSSPREVAEALVAAAAWSTEFDFCTPAVDSHLGQWSVWRGLVADERRLRRAFVALDGLRSEPHALTHLHRLGALRLVPAADGSFRSHVFRFRRDGRVRVLSGSGALCDAGIMAPLDGLTIWEGDELGGYALHVERLFEHARRCAHVPEPEELDAYAAMYFDAAPHRAALAEIGAPLIRGTAVDAEMVDLELATCGRAVRDAVAVMKRQLTAAATLKSRQTIGYHGGSAVETVYWSTPLGMWSLFRDLDGRYGNSFGLERPGSAKSLRITVEVNPPVEGIDRKTGGAIARERGTATHYLVHRGRIGGGQKGIGSDLFWSRFRGGVRLLEADESTAARVVVVGEIGAPSFPRDVAAFVHEVGRIKRVATR